MPFGSLPTSGGGLRCWQIYQGLKSAGFEVIASMPAFTYLTTKYFDEIPEDVREYLWEWHTQDTILNKVKPDVVIYSSNWDHYNLSRKPDVPLVIDLHGSRLIETSLWGHPADTNKKVDVFSKADCFICAGRRQRMYFYGWLTQAGRVPERDHLIRYIPISLSPEDFKRNPEGDNATSDYPFFVSGGGWFPWQDQSRAIFSVCNEIVKRDNGLVKIYGTPHDNNSVSPEEMKIREIFKEVKALSEKHNRVQVPGYVGRDALLEEYSRASVAIELMRYNLERELAFTTRTIEYLWCGLPVIYNNYSEISDHISEYDAGWTISPDSDSEISNVLEEIFNSPETVKRKSENAKRLVRDRFTWDKTIAPLVDFINNPVRLPVSKPVKGFIPRSAPFCAPIGVPVSLKVKSNIKISQEFIFPSEGIWAIEVPFKKVKSSTSQSNILDSNELSPTVRLELRSKLGFKIGSISYNSSKLGSEGAFLLPIYRIFRPLGGSKAKLIISFDGVSKSQNNVISLTAFRNEVFPLMKSSDLVSVVSSGNIAMEGEISPEVLQIRFHAGGARLYHLRSKIEQAYWLLRKGEFKKISRGVLRVVHRLKSPINRLFARV